ncbi:CBM9 family sugar-binding protein [Chitinophagales bacterium]|nr:CBM9 family sugar-binding protein [Chitinophagales bacterium]
MKKQLLITLLLILCTACQSSSSGKAISYAADAIVIDGKASDAGWQNTSWQAMDQTWLGSEYSAEDFSGRYKLAWDQDHLYVLAEITDDVLRDTHPNGLVNYWDDDCLEVFIDEDASGGDHQYNYNAFAYHIALNSKVTDIGTDSIPHYYDHIKCRRLTKGHQSTWELAIEIYDDSYELDGANEKVALRAEKQIGFAIAYCDNDNSKERENFIGSTVVEGEDKNRGWIDAGIFEEHVLVR